MGKNYRRDMPLKYNFERQVPEVNTRIGHSDRSKGSPHDAL